MVHLLLSLWKILFTQIWDLQNGELPGKNGLVEAYERSILKRELEKWKRNAGEKIGADQTYLAEYDLLCVWGQLKV